MARAYRSKTLIQASFWISAVLVGLAAVFYGELIEWLQHQYFTLARQFPVWTLGTTPALFLLSVYLVKAFAPEARGSGIPQALKATMMSLASHQTALKSGLISIKTMVVKVLSSSIGILAGASIGREGPTVQISTSLFAFIGSRAKRLFPHIDFHSYLVAGAAAGVAAAFNTPLAGISFAIEEIAEGSFAQIKQTVMVSVIIAGITAQSLVGNYSYFGNPEINLPEVGIVGPAITIGLAGGLVGAIFSRALIFPIFDKIRVRWWQVALLCGAVCAVFNYFSGYQSAGTGYEITREFMNSENPEEQFGQLFAVNKIVTTVFSYLSGMAGGIFAPSLAIGAGMGATIAKLAAFAQFKMCALLGMVAFFTGAVQAPLTAVIIVMEMTDVNEFIIPLMISAFVAQGVAKLIMPTSLYRYLAHNRGANSHF